MDFLKLFNKKELYHRIHNKMNEFSLSSYEQDFELKYAHHSTAIEGNTLTLIETKVLLEDGISIGGKALREIYEVVNHNSAYQYIKKSIKDGVQLDENVVKETHRLLTVNILHGGIYSDQVIKIAGAPFIPPIGKDMYEQIKFFYNELANRNDLNPIELAAWAHAEFVRIHPFIDGNRRTSRLIMNYVLMENGFLPVSIDKGDRLEYYNALERYATEGDLSLLLDLIAKLEEEQLDNVIGLYRE